MAAKVTEAQLWAEILAACTPPRREPGEKTAYEIADESGASREAVVRMMGRLVKAGRMTTRKVVLNGKWVRVYRPRAG